MEILSSSPVFELCYIFLAFFLSSEDIFCLVPFEPWRLVLSCFPLSGKDYFFSCLPLEGKVDLPLAKTDEVFI